MAVFGELFRHHLEARELTQRAFGKAVKYAHSFIAHVGAGDRLPPLDCIAEWADTLKLTGQEREDFIRAAYLAHCPEPIRDDYLRLRARVDKLERRVAEFEDKYKA